MRTAWPLCSTINRELPTKFVRQAWAMKLKANDGFTERSLWGNPRDSEGSGERPPGEDYDSYTSGLGR